MLANHHAPNAIALTALVLFLAACALRSALRADPQSHSHTHAGPVNHPRANAVAHGRPRRRSIWDRNPPSPVSNPDLY